MLLGFARNKLGDLVFSRSDGQQVIRARNRAPKNPNSDKQLVQRAIMANVMQLYSIGQSIFNHSFQGKAVGAQNQREFIRINTNKLRGLVVGDLNSAATPADCAGRVGARGINVAVPFVGMQISKGTYQQSLFTEDNGVFKMPDPVADETVAAYAQRVGLIAEDIYTFVGIAVNYSEVVANLNAEEESASGNLDRMYNSRFEYVQLKVKSGLSAITDTITSATLISTLFDLYNYSGEPLTDLTIGNGISLPDFISWQDGGAIGCIRSREFEDLRSSSYMIASTGSYNWGFASAYLLDVWNAGTTLQGTDLILEGSNFSLAGGSAAPTLEEVLYTQNQVEESPTYLKWLPLMKMSNGSTYTPVVAVPGDPEEYGGETTLYYSLYISKLIDEEKQGQGSDRLGVDTFVWIDNPDTGSEPFTTDAYHVEDGDIRQVAIQGVQYPAAYRVVARMAEFDASAITSLLNGLTEGQFIYHAP